MAKPETVYIVTGSCTYEYIIMSPCNCARETFVRGTCHLTVCLRASENGELRLRREPRMNPVLLRRAHAHTTMSENRMRNRSLFCTLPFCGGRERWP